MQNNRIIQIDIDIDEAGTRIDKYLCDLLSDFSRSRIQNLIKDQHCVVNNKHIKSAYRLKYGDNVLINVPEAKPLELNEENIPLDVRFEDKNMLVVNKPSGMLTHPTSIERDHTLVNALLHHCKGNLSGINGIMRPGILHRLDRDTSGLLMIAKNDFAHNFLTEQVKNKTAIRQYLTILHGNLKEKSGTISAPIDRHPSQKHKMAVVEGGKKAITHWKLLENLNGFSFIEVTLETGRTHQIRVHFSNTHHPVIGDPIYGGGNIKFKLNGQALQAYKLTFTSPTNNERITIEINKDNKINKALRILKNDNQET